MTIRINKINVKKIKALISSVISVFKKKRYIVANSGRGLIAYDEKNYDKIVEAIGYVTPVEVIRFDNWDKAMNYCEQHSNEYFSSYEDDFIDY